MSIQPYEPKPQLPAHQAETDLVQWAVAAADVYKVAEMLAQTTFVSKSLYGKPQEVAAQILYGREVNLSPMVALQQINIIDGRPSMSALSMRGLAQANGIKFTLHESGESRCKMSAQAPGDREPTTITWTIDRAKKLGLTGKRNWTSQPQAMLIARATSELCRLVAAPLFLGMAYSTEELRDGVDQLADVHQEPPAPAEEDKPRTLRRQPVKATASVPQKAEPTDEEHARQVKLQREAAESFGDSYSTQDIPAREPGAEVPREVVDPKVRAALQIAFKTAGLDDRQTRLSYVSDLLKREVHSFNQLSAGEAKTVLDQLHIDLADLKVQVPES